MKKYLMITLLICSFSIWAQTPVVSIGFFESYPHNYINQKGEVEGVAISYMNALAKKLDTKSNM